MKQLLYAGLMMLVSAPAAGQVNIRQYFDGADTLPAATLTVRLDTGAGAGWQVGKPVKTFFHSAATQPRALVTDTAVPYAANATARAYFGFRKLLPYGVAAVRWKQKLDLDTGLDGAIVEYSTDSGATWKNVFNNPEVYNFYGFQASNRDTLPNGQFCFSGRDTTWRDVWLCFDFSFLYDYDSTAFRFTLRSDSVHSGKEGWMIDNLLVQQTIWHTVKKGPSAKYLTVYPTQTTGLVHIEAEKRNEYHIIESIELLSADGRVAQRWGRAPTKYFVDIGAHPPGRYYLKVQTNVATETMPLLLQP